MIACGVEAPQVRIDGAFWVMFTDSLLEAGDLMNKVITRVLIDMVWFHGKRRSLSLLISPKFPHINIFLIDILDIYVSSVKTCFVD